MINARYDEEFIFHDGTSAKNILELVLKLEHMSNSEFCTFVNWDKNDFSNWISIVLNDKHLADNLRMIFSREETILLLRARINELSQEQITESSIIATHNIINGVTHGVSSTNMLNAPHHYNIPLLSQSAIRVSLKDNSTNPINSSNSIITPTSLSNVNTSNSANQDINHVTKQDNSLSSKEVKSSRNWFNAILQKASFKKKSDELPQDTKLYINKVSSTASSSKIDVNSSINNSVSNSNNSTINNNQLYRTNHNAEKIVNTNDAKTATKISLFNLFSHKSKSSSLNTVVVKRLFFRRVKPDNIKPNNNLTANNTEKKSEEVVIYEHNHLWMVLYIILIVLIVLLLIYKLFLV